jgi:hypothetical protein
VAVDSVYSTKSPSKKVELDHQAHGLVFWDAQLHQLVTCEAVGLNVSFVDLKQMAQARVDRDGVAPRLNDIVETWEINGATTMTTGSTREDVNTSVPEA